MKAVGVLLAWIWMSFLSGAWGQEDAVQTIESLAQVRSRIDNERKQKTVELDAQDAACLSTFRVTDCQNRVSTLRRKMLADAKHQESALNDIQRRQKAEDQRMRSENKAVERAQREAELQAPQTADSPDERKKKQEDKALNHHKQASPPARKASETKAASGLDAQALERNRASYLEKQKAADKRRQERDQRLLDKGPSRSPLPVAP